MLKCVKGGKFDVRVSFIFVTVRISQIKKLTSSSSSSSSSSLALGASQQNSHIGIRRIGSDAEVDKIEVVKWTTFGREHREINDFWEAEC